MGLAFAGFGLIAFVGIALLEGALNHADNNRKRKGRGK